MGQGSALFQSEFSDGTRAGYDALVQCEKSWLNIWRMLRNYRRFSQLILG